MTTFQGHPLDEADFCRVETSTQPDWGGLIIKLELLVDFVVMHAGDGSLATRAVNGAKRENLACAASSKSPMTVFH